MRTSNLPGKLQAALMTLFCAALVAASPAAAQKKGGTLRLYHNDNPPSTSLHEEATIASVTPFAAIFNNLVVFDPAKVHESIDTVIPDLAESWSWDATNTDYWKKDRPYLDEITFRMIDSRATRMLAFATGEAGVRHR